MQNSAIITRELPIGRRGEGGHTIGRRWMWGSGIPQNRPPLLVMPAVPTGPLPAMRVHHHRRRRRGRAGWALGARRR